MTDTTKPPPTDETPAAVKALKVAAYPTAAAMGGLFAHISMRNSIYSRLKKYGMFDDIVKNEKNGHDAKLTELFSESGPTNVLSGLMEENKNYNRQIKQRMEERGFKHSYNYWQGIHDTEKLEAFTAFATAAGVTLGVLLTIANSKAMLDRFGHKKDQDETLSR